MALNVSNAQADDGLSLEEIEARFAEIRQSYSVGDYLSSEDWIFIQRYADAVDTKSARAEKGFTTSGKQGSTSVSVSGTAYFNMINVGYFNWGARATLTKFAGPTPQSMALTAQCTAWGVGEDGLPAVFYDRSLTDSNQYENVLRANPNAYCTGAPLFKKMSVYADIYTGEGGFFTITALSNASI